MPTLQTYYSYIFFFSKLKRGRGWLNELGSSII